MGEPPRVPYFSSQSLVHGQDPSTLHPAQGGEWGPEAQHMGCRAWGVPAPGPLQPCSLTLQSSISSLLQPALPSYASLVCSCGWPQPVSLLGPAWFWLPEGQRRTGQMPGLEESGRQERSSAWVVASGHEALRAGKSLLVPGVPRVLEKAGRMRGLYNVEMRGRHFLWRRAWSGTQQGE